MLLFATSGGQTIKRVSSGLADEQICGKWQSAEKNLVVQVYKVDDQFKAKIIWFNDADDSKPMDYWTDKKNPDPALRSRRYLALICLRN